MKRGVFYIGLCLIVAISGCGGDESDEPLARFIRSEPSDGQTITFGDSASPQITLNLFFDNPLHAVAVNGIFGSVSENRAIWTGWTQDSYDPVEKKLRLSVVWWNQNGTVGGRETIILYLHFIDHQGPQVIGGNIRDGQRDIDPELLNEVDHEGVTIEFNEPIARASLTLTPDMVYLYTIRENKVIFIQHTLKGAPWHYKYNTTYTIQGFVEDAAGNQSEVLIRFTTRNVPPEQMNITVIPKSGSFVAENAKIKIVFDNPVKAVLGATGEGQLWFMPVTPVLNVTWMNFDDSFGGTVTFTYELGPPDFEPPQLVWSNVTDGDRDVDPKLNDFGFEIEFNEDILFANVLLIDENGIDMRWRSSVFHFDEVHLSKKVVHLGGWARGVDTAKNLGLGRTYRIVGEVEDWSGNKTQIDITFTIRDKA